jgi:methionine aminopeptidase
VNIDVTTYSRGGYHGDLNETFCVGNVDADGRRVVQTAFECLQSALALVRPGTLYRDLGSTIHRVAAAQQCSVVRTYCGHGIGSLFHTAPNVPVSRAVGRASFRCRSCRALLNRCDLPCFVDSTMLKIRRRES